MNCYVKHTLTKKVVAHYKTREILPPWEQLQLPFSSSFILFQFLPNLFSIIFRNLSSLFTSFFFLYPIHYDQFCRFEPLLKGHFIILYKFQFPDPTLVIGVVQWVLSNVSTVSKPQFLFHFFCSSDKLSIPSSR